MKPIALIFYALATVLVGCSKNQTMNHEGEWWGTMLAHGKTPITALPLAAGQMKNLVVEGEGNMRLGVLVRDVVEMKSSVERSGDKLAVVYLEQSASKNHVGTYYAASVVFDLSKGRDFTVQNRSTIATQVLVYRDSEP